MSRLCLDTSAYSHFKRGNSAVVEHIDTAEWIGVPSVVLGELWAGFLDGSRADRNRAELTAFLANPVVNELVVDHDVARLYGEIYIALKKAGMPVPTNDMWVAACAARHGATILTFDAHFQSIRRIGAIVLEQS